MMYYVGDPKEKYFVDYGDRNWEKEYEDIKEYVNLKESVGQGYGRFKYFYEPKLEYKIEIIYINEFCKCCGPSDDDMDIKFVKRSEENVIKLKILVNYLDILNKLIKLNKKEYNKLKKKIIVKIDSDYIDLDFIKQREKQTDETKNFIEYLDVLNKIIKLETKEYDSLKGRIIIDVYKKK